MSEAPELLPCPFCAANAATQQNGFIGGDLSRPTYWEVVCIGCDLGLSDFETELAAITAWNTRADLVPKVKPLVEALKKAQWALQPFSDRVYHDNGDCTVSDTHPCSGKNFVDAHFVYKDLRRILSALETPETET